MDNNQQALRRVIEIAGGGVELARLVGVTPQAVSQWLRQGVPPARVIQVEAAVRGEVSRHELRPDIFGPADTAEAQVAG